MNINKTGLILAVLGVLGQLAVNHGYDGIGSVLNDPNFGKTLGDLGTYALLLYAGAHSGKAKTDA